MKLAQGKNKRGFTLIELLVVITIIAMLSAAALAFLFEARKESRDMMRVSDAEQLKLGVRLYKEAHGEYPNYVDGADIGVGGPIDAQLQPFLKKINRDPSWVSGGPYGYSYKSNFSCAGAPHEVIIVKTMEFAKFANMQAVCGHGGATEYILLIN